MSQFKRIISLIYCGFYDIWLYLKDIVYVHIRRDHLRIKKEYQGLLPQPKKSKKIAVVAIFPSNESILFTKNLLDALVVNDFFILIVSTRSLTQSQEEIVLARCHHLIDRYNMGQDFGSYQYGLNWLKRNGNQLDSAEHLLIANDSMFYPENTKNIVTSMLERDDAWQCLFENFQSYYHAQSFFLLFKNEVFLSAAFKNFWQHYTPTCSRARTINQGEKKLTKKLMKGGFFPHTFYNATHIIETLHAYAQTNEENSEQFCENLIRMLGKLPKNIPKSSTQNSFMRVTTIVGRLMHTTNPTQTTGLTISYLMKAPLKRDICYRGSQELINILHHIRGFTPEEMLAMNIDFRKKGMPAGITGFRALLYNRGRI